MSVDVKKCPAHAGPPHCVGTQAGEVTSICDGEGAREHSWARTKASLMEVHQVTGIKKSDYGVTGEFFGAARSSGSEI